MVNNPEEFDVAVSFVPFSTEITVIVAPLMGSPELPLTVPRTVPYTAWDRAGTEADRRKASAPTAKQLEE
jgi:hypothetical protein